jgi:hypothetical protein
MWHGWERKETTQSLRHRWEDGIRIRLGDLKLSDNLPKSGMWGLLSRMLRQVEI